MSAFILSLNKASIKDIKTVGGKAASLGELMHFGIPVPDGFIISADAFNYFLKETDLNTEIEAQLRKANCSDINLINGVSNIICGLIEEAEIPKEIIEQTGLAFEKLKTKFVAVRSSATAEDSSSDSWAGELETYLNVKKGNLLNKTKKCWASLFTPRAIFYRLRRGIHIKRIAVAVIIQSMIQSEISGVCFTVHPINKDRNQILIEAGYGLGEAIVTGMITPDSYVVDKRKRIILDKNINRQKIMVVRGNPDGTREVSISKLNGNKQKLSDGMIIRLSKLCYKIEKYYGHPQDIEWAFARGKFYILQSRPITTL